MKKKLPFIFIFDIDNTIVGKVRNLIHEYYILELINSNLVNNMDITEELRNYILRPNFKDFIDFINKKYKNVEIYVYSLGSFRWVNTITPNIEKSINITINKPYFSRIDCFYNMEKLLGNIYDTIINDLEYKYPTLKDINNKEYVFKNQLVFIDDIKNNLKDYPKKQILCSSFNNNIFIDIISNIIRKYGLKEEEIYNEKVFEYLYNNQIPTYNKNSQFLAHKNKYYYNLILLLKEREKELLNDYKDTFFKSLIDIIEKNNITLFNDETIEIINKNLL